MLGLVDNSFAMPFSSALSSNNIKLALSLVDQHIEFYSTSSTELWYSLYDNYPTASNSTTAVFRVYFWAPAINIRAKIRYLACPVEILSSNFQILFYTIGIGYYGGTNPTQYNTTISESLNTTGSYGYSIYIRSFDIRKSEAGSNYHLEVGFNPPNQLYAYSTTVMYSWQIDINLLFYNSAVSQVSGYNLLFPTSYYLYGSGSWVFSSFYSYIDNTNTICGLKTINFLSNYLNSILTISGKVISYQSSMSFSNYWGQGHCLVVISKICP